MAEKASPRNRAQLIREMSKDMKGTRSSSRSSVHSQSVVSPEPTKSDFDPENEALMSTRQLDNRSQKLPELRASANKYSRFDTPAEPDFAINTSAIGRAFPSFSQGGSSSEDDSLSIEIGRGARKSSNGTIAKLGCSREHSSNIQMSFEGDSMEFSAPMIGNYEVTTTPPLRQRQTSTKMENSKRQSMGHTSHARQSSRLQNEILDPSPPPAKIRDYGSGESRKASSANRRTLSSMHARVQEENDQSRLSDERPATVEVTARNTRFGNTRNLHPPSQGSLPTRFSSAQTLLDHVAPVNRKKPPMTAISNQGTQQSFILPDLPNISELVSGVFEDGTPVFSRHGKPRASRFTAKLGQKQGNAQNYAGVNEIPIPDDEQAIFLSLKLLQDKVAALEKSNAEAATNIDELQQRNRVLEAEKSERKKPRGDSALGTTDSDGDHNHSGRQRGLLIEKNRLESSARALQREVDAGKRKYSTAETILRNITQERDSAVSQLGVAFVTIEQLKIENESLRAENGEFKSRLGSIDEARENNTSRRGAEDEMLRRKPDLRTGTIKNKTEDADARQSGLQKANSPPKSRRKARSDFRGRNVDHSAPNHVDTMFDLNLRQDTKNLQSRDNHPTAQIEYEGASDDSLFEAPTRKGKGEVQGKPSRSTQAVRDQEASQDLTYLSFLDNREIAQLRKTLEQERIERKQRRDLQNHALKENPTITQTGSVQHPAQSTGRIPPRKSSLKDLTAKSVKQQGSIETFVDPRDQAEHSRRHSETSILNACSGRRRLDGDNMTSAFIVPDITIRNAELTNKDVPELIGEAQEAAEDLAKHDGQNCTVCKRIVGPNESHEHKETIKITKPVPVSERQPKATDNDEDPTIRPAQTPGLALATVLKELEDELAHMKIQLSRYQTLYNGHDPALSKRRRKSVQQKIENILQAVDVKADQIYALYDVLEGQKQDGHEIGDEEVELTLQSIGIKAPELHLRGGGSDDEDNHENGKATQHHPWDLESAGDSSEDLPWEGIESTVETTKSGFARAGRRAKANV